MHVSGHGKAPAAYRTITEVAAELDIPQHVLRFWEGRFPQIRPVKRGGGRRYYRPDDIDLLRRIRKLLYEDGYTIRGAQKLLRDERGVPAPQVLDLQAPDLQADSPSLSPANPALPFLDAAPAAGPVAAPPQGKSRRAAAALPPFPPPFPPPSLPAAKRDALWDILIELRALRGTLRK